MPRSKNNYFFNHLDIRISIVKEYPTDQTQQVPQISLGSKKEAISRFMAPLIYTGLVLHSQKLAWFHLALTQDRRKAAAH